MKDTKMTKKGSGADAGWVMGVAVSLTFYRGGNCAACLSEWICAAKLLNFFVSCNKSAVYLKECGRKYPLICAITLRQICANLLIINYLSKKIALIYEYFKKELSLKKN